MQATCIEAIGDVYFDKKEYTDAEKYYREAQIMITGEYGEMHPIVIRFNNTLIEVISSKDVDGQVKDEITRISERNLEISEVEFGKNSIYTIKPLLTCGSQYMSTGEIQKGQEAIATMKAIV